MFTLSPFPLSEIPRELCPAEFSESRELAAPPDEEFFKMRSRPPVSWLILSVALMVRAMEFRRLSPIAAILGPLLHIFYYNYNTIYYYNQY